MHWTILWPILVFFLGLSVASLWAQRRARLQAQRHGFVGEYFLGSRSLKGFVLAMTLFATYGSVSSFVSGPGLAWQYGLGWVVFAAPQIITGFLLLGVLGKKLGLVSRATGAVTIVDLIRLRFNSRLLGDVCAVALLVFFTAMMTGQFIGGAAIFAQAAGLDPFWALLAFASLVVLYTTFGGYRAVTWTDTLCAFLMIAGLFFLAYAIFKNVPDMSSLLVSIQSQATQAQRPDFFGPNAGGALPWTLLLSAWILVGFGTIGLPQSAVRCMSYQNAQDVHTAMIVTTIVCGFLLIGLTLVGFLARGLPDLTLAPGQSTDYLIPKLISTQLNPTLAGITLIGPLAATMSTVSSLLIAASSAIIKDLLMSRNFFQKRAQKRVHQVSRLSTLVLGLIALGFAMHPTDAMAWINIAAFGGLELIFLLPLLGAFFWPRANAKGALASIVVGQAIYLHILYWKTDIAGFHAVVPALIGATLAFIVVSLKTAPDRHDAMKYFFPSEKRPS